MATRKMHQTTVRFGPDLWEALEREAGAAGVSVAQFIREAALTRIVYAAGRRGDAEFERALELVAPGESERDHADLERLVGRAGAARTPHERAVREGADASALAAQSRVARQHAQELRERAARRRQG